jgi:asparagine N-glycosylation enzyme membrane subunit Stt3
MRLSEVGLAADDASAGAGLLMLAAVLFGLSVFLGPMLSKKPGRAGDGFMGLLAAAFAAGAVVFFNFAREKGARLLWGAYAQIVALAAILVGTILRIRAARRRRT